MGHSRRAPRSSGRLNLERAARRWRRAGAKTQPAILPRETGAPARRQPAPFIQAQHETDGSVLRGRRLGGLEGRKLALPNRITSQRKRRPLRGSPYPARAARSRRVPQSRIPPRAWGIPAAAIPQGWSHSVAGMQLAPSQTGRLQHLGCDERVQLQVVAIASTSLIGTSQQRLSRNSMKHPIGAGFRVPVAVGGFADLLPTKQAAREQCVIPLQSLSRYVAGENARPP